MSSPRSIEKPASFSCAARSWALRSFRSAVVVAEAAIATGASLSRSHPIARMEMEHMPVVAGMSRSVVTLTLEQTLREAINLLQSKHIRHLPVIGDSKVVGIVTDRDVKRATPSLLSGIDRNGYERVLKTTTIAHFMTREPLTVTPNTRLKAARQNFPRAQGRSASGCRRWSSRRHSDRHRHLARRA